MNEFVESLQARIAQLEKELEEKKQTTASLERTNRELEQKIKSQPAASTPLSELEETLRRFVAKIAAILQAEKCTFMIFNAESGELEAAKPAFGISDEELQQLRVRASDGISGEVFREQKPVIIYDPANDPRTVKENINLLRIKNGLCVPLVIEKRDEETNELIESRPIGVLHVFNKRGSVFIQEDVNLLTRLAKNAASVISSAQMYREVVKEKEQIDRMKTAFVSTVSHELRTPLTSIKGFIATLLDDEDAFDADLRHEFYTIIDQECDRLTRMISDLLDVSRIEAGRAMKLQPKWIDLVPLVEKITVVQKSFTDKHSFDIHFEDALPQVFADEDKVAQILTNLLSNAVKYSPRGGVVSVGCKRGGEGVRVSITDQGIGIPPEHCERIFDWFHRVDNRDTREVGGTGIGLYLVKNLVEAHGGRVWVESEVGVGSTFTFEIPIAPAQFAAEMKEQRAARAN